MFAWPRSDGANKIVDKAKTKAWVNFQSTISKCRLTQVQYVSVFQ